MLRLHLTRSQLSINLSALLLAALTAAVAFPQPPATRSRESVASPLSPEDSLPLFRLPAGLRIQIAAAEPQVVDPVAIRFDSRGRMWVAEMGDYPNGPQGDEPPRSRIKLLEDQDGDGRYETAHIFADKLLFANGLQPWKTGVIATIAGKVVYLPDDDQDHRADRMEVWYAGFAQENSQLRANHPTLGLDNYVYVANGLRGGTVVDARDPKAKPVSISGMDFRFHPLTGAYEAISGVGQFGLTFDSAGNRFVCSNRNPVKHIVLPNRYTRFNPKATVRQVAHDVAKAGADSQLFPLSRAWTTSTLHANQFTAACGVTIYEGDALPDAYRGNAFTCDPTGNLVHREIMTPQGATFASRPARKGVEFLASPDEWFRPVNMACGPDGALYIVDMYRAVIEHPQFVPEELKRRPDERFGEDRGRIYRIVPVDFKHSVMPLAKPQSRASAERLVEAIGSQNAWTRDTAARLILSEDSESEQADTITNLLNRCLQEGPALAQARALWLLHAAGKLTPEAIQAALRNADPSVRRQALRLSETLPSSPELDAAVAGLAKDPDAAVRYQLLLTLTASQAENEAAIAEVGLRSADDPWTRQAVLLAAKNRIQQLVAQLHNYAAAKELSGPQKTLFLDVLRGAAKNAPQSEDLQRVVGDAASRGGAWGIDAVNAYAEGLAQARSSLNALVAKNKSLRDGVEHTVGQAVTTSQESQSDSQQRVAAIRLLGFAAPRYESAQEALRTVAGSKEHPQQVRLAGFSAVTGTAPDAFVAEQLDAFPGESPAIRRAILDLALARTGRIALLLDRVESGVIKLGEIDRIRTDRLLKITTTEIRPRIAKAFADAIPQDRKKVLADYQSILSIKADPRRGELVFRNNCATCHRVGRWGVDVAPDIADSRTRKPTQLLTDILQPNRAIDSNYISYSVVTVDGKSFTGVLALETSDSITLKLPEGKSLALSRDEIEEMRSNGISLMPEGLEKNINKQQMADLISYIKNWRYLDGRTPYTE